MASITLALTDELDSYLDDRVRSNGGLSKEDYLIRLVEADRAQEELERVLLDRMDGPFEPLLPDCQARVRQTGMQILNGES